MSETLIAVGIVFGLFILGFACGLAWMYGGVKEIEIKKQRGLIDSPKQEREELLILFIASIFRVGIIAVIAFGIGFLISKCGGSY